MREYLRNSGKPTVAYILDTPCGPRKNAVAISRLTTGHDIQYWQNIFTVWESCNPRSAGADSEGGPGGPGPPCQIIRQLYNSVVPCLSTFCTHFPLSSDNIMLLFINICFTFFHCPGSFCNITSCKKVNFVYNLLRSS